MPNSPSLQVRLVAVSVLLVSQLALVYGFAIREVKINTIPLETVPTVLGSWEMVGQQEIAQGVLDYLKPKDYVNRSYQLSSKEQQIDLFVAYFDSLQNAEGPHSPRQCLPGAGWRPVSNQEVSLSVPGRTHGIPVNRYLLEMNKQRILVYYWYQNDRNVYAREVLSKLYLLPDLVRYKRTDVALVRVISGYDDKPEIEERMKGFIQLIFPELVRHFSEGA